MSGFATAEARKLPRLACIGYVDDAKDVKETESGVYANFRVTIKGNSGASRTVTTNFLFRPEWFTPGFDPKTIQQLDDPDLSPEEVEKLRNGIYSVYRRLFGTADTLGELTALVGGPDNLDKLAQKRDELYAKVNRELTKEEVFELVKTFILESPVQIGYVLKQAREKTDEVGSDGKAVYILRDQYEIDEWGVPTEDWRKRMIKRAKMSKDNSFLVAFEV